MNAAGSEATVQVVSVVFGMKNANRLNMGHVAILLRCFFGVATGKLRNVLKGVWNPSLVRPPWPPWSHSVHIKAI